MVCSQWRHPIPSITFICTTREHLLHPLCISLICSLGVHPTLWRIWGVWAHAGIGQVWSRKWKPLHKQDNFVACSSMFLRYVPSYLCYLFLLRLWENSIVVKNMYLWLLIEWMYLDWLEEKRINMAWSTYSGVRYKVLQVVKHNSECFVTWKRKGEPGSRTRIFLPDDGSDYDD